MADVTGPLGGDSGGKEVEAAAKRQLAEAEAEVRQIEKVAADTEASQKKVTQRAKSAGSRVAKARALTAEEIAKVEAKIQQEEERLAREAIPGQGALPTISQSKRDFQRRPNRVPDYLTNKGALNQRWEREFRAALQSGVQFTPSKFLDNNNPLRGLLADVGQPAQARRSNITYASNAAGRAAEAAAKKAEQQAAREEPAVVEKAEERKTTAVEKGSRKRAAAKKAEGDVTKKAGGDLNEFNRILAGREGELQRQAAIADQYERRVKAGDAPAPGDAAYKAEVARQEADLRAREELRSRALILHPTARLHGPEDDPEARRAYALRERERYAPGYAPGPRSPLEAADREVARARIAAAASQKDLQAATRRATGATAAEAGAAAKEVEDLTRKHAANQTALAAAQENAAGIRRENATRFAAAQPGPYRPGTDIIRHPTLYGQRVPGPFGQVFGPREPSDIEKQLSSRQIARDPRQRAAAASASKVGKEEARAARVAAAAEERHVANLDAVAHAEATAEQRMAVLTQQVRYQAAALGGLDGNYRRHGALTTEFIQAAARGEATYREWGFQIGATAAKFGAWTLVSIPVIAALDGVRHIGQGAIDSASGVNVLQRSLDHVDARAAQRAFRQLSGQFNLPIGDVVEAVYRSSQVFHRQADAVDAARAALYSYQVGEVSVADSTRYLNAIASGAGLTGAGGGKAILSLFDQINQAQNRFGINIRSTEAGMARAAGAFTNAGGSLSYLLALITTGSRVTGRTGENIGTALQRSVGFIQRPTNRARLREFGIDPNQGVQSVYEQAFQTAQGLHGPRLQQLATALSSPQYASYLVPILQNRKLFQRVQAETSPEASRGSAQRELSHVLDQIDEQIKRIGVGLGQLGSNLAQSGLLAGFGAFIGLLNTTLGVTNRILDVFNQLPDPIKQGLTTLLQMRLVLAGIRRANLGEALVGGRADKLAPFFIESDSKRARRIVGKGVRTAATEFEDQQVKAQSAAFLAALNAKTAETVRAQEKVRLDRLLAEGSIDSATAAELQAASAEKALAATARSEEASRAAAVKLVDTAAAKDLEAAFQRDVVKGRVPADEFARTHGVYFPPVLDNPVTHNQLMRDHILAGGDPALLVDDAAAFRGRPPRRFDAGGVATSSARALSSEARNFGTLSRNIGLVSAAEVTFGRGMEGVRNATRVATVATEAAATRAVATAASLAASAGPTIALIAAITLIPKVLESRKKNIDEQAARANRARGRTPSGNLEAPHTRAALENYRRQLEGDANHRDSLLDRIDNVLTHPIFGGKSPSDKNQFKSGASAQLAQLNDRYRRQQAAIRTGQPVPELTYEGLKTRLDRDFDQFDQGQITLKQLRDRQGIRLAEIRSSLVTPDTAGALRSRYLTQLLQRTQGRTSIADQLTAGGGLAGLPAQSIDDTSEGLAALLQGNLATGSQRTKYLELQLVKAARSVHATGPVGQKRYAEASQAITEALQNVGKAELDRALQVAKTQAQRDAAYDKYQNTLTRAGTVAQRALLSSLRRQQRQQRQRYRALTGPDATLLSGTPSAAGNPITGLLGDLGSVSLQSQLQALTAQTPQLIARILGAKEGIKNRAKAIRRVQKALDDAMAPIRAEIAAMRAQSAQADASDAIQKQASLIQAQTQLAAARAGSEVGSQSAQIGGLGRLLAFQRAHRGTYSEADVVGTEAQLADAQHQLGLTMQQQARDLIAAQAEYRKSLTDNPVKQAQIDARTAQRQLAYGHFDTPAARLQALAERNRTRRDAYKAASDRQIEDLDLQHDIGKLSDQAYISALKRIERTTKAGAEYKRQLHARILRLQHDVQNDSDLDLNVGDLRLPTVYDVRRLARQGLNSPVVNQTNHYTIPVRNDGDLERLGGELRSIHGSNVVGALRSAGLR